MSSAAHSKVVEDLEDLLRTLEMPSPMPVSFVEDLLKLVN